MSPVVVFTHSGDLHASHFADIALGYGKRFHLVFTDKASATCTFSFCPNECRYSFTDVNGETVHLHEASAIWWRRISGIQQDAPVDSEYQSFVDASWNTLYQGDIARILPQTVLVNDPVKTKLGYNKVVQLHMARELGFDIPLTLISNDLQNLRETFAGLKTIVKPLVSDSKHPIYVKDIDLSSCDERQIAPAPCIYQHKLDSTVNYRVNVFGDAVYSFRITNENIDWRTGDYRIEKTSLDKAVEERCRSFIRESGLAMGCIDLKEDGSGNIFFLENNPQGQFDFIEAKSGYPLMRHFVNFILTLSR